jgi:hypothetical protein
MPNVENYCYLFRFAVEIEKEAFTYLTSSYRAYAGNFLFGHYAMERTSPS